MSDICVNIESEENVSAVTVVGTQLSANPRLLAEFLNTFHKNGAPLHGMSSNYNSIVFYGPQRKIEQCYEELHEVVTKNKETTAISRRDGLGIVVINGIGLQETPGSMARCSSALQKNGINIYGQYTVMSEIFFVTQYEDRKKTAGILMDEFDINGEENGKD